MKMRLAVVENRLGSMGNRLNRMDERLTSLDESITSLKRDVTSLKESVNTRFEAQDKKLDQLLLLLTTFTTKPEQENLTWGVYSAAMPSMVGYHAVWRR